MTLHDSAGTYEVHKPIPPAFPGDKERAEYERKLANWQAWVAACQSGLNISWEEWTEGKR